tara:strand:+ start:19569 stop:20210 length:642 start_codon:yes stop_codon:yes gene_type:complete
MSTPADVIQLINDEITDNGANLISAAVLRPVLIEMVNQINGVVGDPLLLSTVDKEIVGSINEVIASMTSTFTLFSGTDDPNTTAPVGATTGDFYSRTAGAVPISYWVLEGLVWLELVDRTVAQSIKTIRNVIISTTVSSEDDTIVYNGTNPADIITIPAANVSVGRIIRVINSSPSSILFSLPYTEYSGAEVSTIPLSDKILIQSNGTNWFKI